MSESRLTGDKSTTLPVSGLPNTADFAAPLEALAPTLPDAIAGYEILGELGRGGMGVVYKVRQIRLSRLVALKMILGGGYASSDELDRFRTEAEAVARLQHPNIVQIYDIGDHHGLPYFSLEYCPGGSLAQKLDGTPLPPRKTAHLVEVLARAVHVAHVQHIVHRDLKPANILLTGGEAPEPRNDWAIITEPKSISWLVNVVPKITDFGLAKKLDAGAGPTPTGAIMGTPSYMAPEQATGQSKDIGPAADVYSLGAILYELLTGRPPFLASTAFDTLTQVITKEPVPPRQLVARIPKDLEKICLKCLHKAPGHRYTKALDLADDLHRFQVGEPIKGRLVGRVERLARWGRRNPAVLGLLLLLGLCATVAWWFAEQAETRALRAIDLENQIHQLQQQIDKHVRRDHWADYSLQIARAQRQWNANNLLEAYRILEGCPKEFRGWEHDYLWTLFKTGSQGPVTLPNCWAISPDGNVAVQENGGNLELINASSGQRITTVQGLGRKSYFSPDGKQIVTHDGLLSPRIVDAVTGQDILTFQEPTSAVVFSPDGQRFLTLPRSNRYLMKIWDAPRRRELLVLKGHKDTISCATFSRDGRRFVTGSADCTVKVWNALTGQEAVTFKGHLDSVRCVAFSPNGESIVSVGEDGTLKLWDVIRAKEVYTLKEDVGTVAFSPDGKRMLGGCGKTVRVWEVATGENTLTLEGHADVVDFVGFSHDGKRIFSRSLKTQKIWDASLSMP